MKCYAYSKGAVVREFMQIQQMTVQIHTQIILSQPSLVGLRLHRWSCKGSHSHLMTEHLDHVFLWHYHTALANPSAVGLDALVVSSAAAHENAPTQH